MPLAERLRAQGIDVWLDRWEMAPGDSLVDRIFEKGIAEADAFVVVLSKISVTKPWVREELDAAVVRSIEDSTRLIPVILDDVAVPAALRHRLWLSVQKDGFEAVVSAIVRTLHGGSDRPPLGPEPTYSAVSTRVAGTGDPVDDAVLHCVAEHIRPQPLNTIVISDTIQAGAMELGIVPEAFLESLHALKRKGLISGEPMAGGLRWAWIDIPAHVWLELEEEAGTDVPSLRGELLAHSVNHGAQIIRAPEKLGYPPRTVRAVLTKLQEEGLLTFHILVNGELSVSAGTALARRALRES